MADSAIPCPSCGAELAAGDSDNWSTAHCRGCGTGLVLCRGPALCSACGIEYHCEAAVLNDGQPVAKCPTCGSTAAVRRPELRPEVKLELLPARPDPVVLRRSPPPLPWPRAPWPPVPRRAPAADSLTSRRARIATAYCVTLLYVVACVLPAARFGEGEFQPGILCLLLGWVTCYYWFPNPLLFAGCILLLYDRSRLAFVMGMLASVCTLPLIFGATQIELSWGFYFWEVDMFLFTFLCGVLWRKYGEPS